MGIASAAELFKQGCLLEETSPEKAIPVYAELLLLEPEHAGALVNMGTLYYNKRDLLQAELFYRRALAVDPRYALAYFDLGNVLDEGKRYKEAESVYLKALALAPDYSDAHYNLAICYQKLKQEQKALLHWKAYRKLDTHGPWADFAAAQIKKSTVVACLEIVVRNPGVRRRQKDELRNPGLFLVKR